MLVIFRRMVAYSPNPEIRRAITLSGGYQPIGKAVGRATSTIRHQCLRGFMAFEIAEAMSKVYGLDQLELMRPPAE